MKQILAACLLVLAGNCAWALDEAGNQRSGGGRRQALEIVPDPAKG